MPARLIRDLKREEKGPWLISALALERLDKTLEAEGKRFADLFQARLVAENPLAKMDPETTRRYSRFRKQRVQVTFRGGRSVIAPTIEEIIRMPELQDLVPIGLEIRLESFEISCELEIEDRDAFGLSSHARLKASPPSDEVAKGAFAAIDSWLDECQQTWLIRKIEEFSILIRGAGLSLLMMSLISAAVTTKTSSVQAAKELLAAGVTSANEHRALELLLRFQLNDNTLAVPIWFWVLFVCSLVLLGGPSLMPQVAIGIGSVGRKRFKAAQWRTKFVFLTVPGAIGATVFQLAAGALWK